jgi:uncharacterized membrane protein required for colicin V production
MAVADLIVIAVIVLLALRGFRRGLLVGVLSLAGLVAGAVLGARLAPGLLGDDAGRYQPLLALGAAMTLAMVGQSLGYLGGRSLRGVLTLPPLRALDNIGGLMLGAATGLVLCWAVGAVLLYVPGETELRRYAQESTILSTLNRELPPDEVMGALSRIDALGLIAGPAANVPPPDREVLRTSDVEIARESVVRLRGNACGLGVEGSGWVAAPELVVTNAHVVAGVERPVVDFGRGATFTGTVVGFDAKSDVAVVRVPGLRALALERAPARNGAAAALLGYPENGPYTATAVRVGNTVSLIGRDAYGRFPTVRRVTAIRGRIRAGNSGGPVVDEQGRVMATVFGGRTGSGDPGGYAVPNDRIAEVLADARRGQPLQTSCVSR